MKWHLNRFLQIVGKYRRKELLREGANDDANFISRSKLTSSRASLKMMEMFPSPPTSVIAIPSGRYSMDHNLNTS
ncbi:hypothetical protein [Thalassoglobus sp.]|uniref:hypothetical protein n=1 Tax=Thalassoglobus sp. TaxID=2795869 RepID=UPI003AA7EE89